MDKLLKGIQHFREEGYEAHKELFRELKDVQKPHTLFITCSDSRIDPNMITGTLPGELFIVRNIANIVPPYREWADYAGTTSAVEYAVLALGVENIILCGHSNCGGCAAGLDPEGRLEGLPHTRKWLELIRPVSDRIVREFRGEEAGVRQWLMEQANVVLQLKNLMSYPYIREGVASGRLQLSGWHYIIETGEVFIYDSQRGAFTAAGSVAEKEG